MKTLNVTDKTGKVVNAVSVTEEDELMLMTSKGQSVRIRAGRAASCHLIDQPTQIFDKDNAQRNRHRPELTDGQHLNLLVGDNEAAEDFGIEMAVGMRHKCPSQTEDPRVTGKWSCGEFG